MPGFTLGSPVYPAFDNAWRNSPTDLTYFGFGNT